MVGITLIAAAWSSALDAQSAPRVVAGVVRDTSGNPVASAEVRVDRDAAAVRTDANGAFSLRTASDSPRIVVRRIGFRPTAMDVVLQAGEAASIDIELVPTAQQMTPIVVAARPQPFESRLSGFNDRSKSKAGHFILRDKLDRLASQRMTDVLRGIPGLRVMQGNRGSGINRTIRLRGATCPPFVFIDGFPAAAGEMDFDSIDPSTVEGIEIYPGLATIPAEFVAARGGERCGVVAIWSRPYKAPPVHRPAAPGVVEQLVASGAVHTPDKVDIRAELKPGTAQIFYPDSLWDRGVKGRVLAEFVVDTSGAVEPGTLGIVASSHPAFSRAVADALAQADFRPAIRNGIPVRQVVQLPFVFEPIRPRNEP